MKKIVTALVMGSVLTAAVAAPAAFARDDRETEVKPLYLLILFGVGLAAASALTTDDKPASS
jgi:hypothetical protein